MLHFSVDSVLNVADSTCIQPLFSTENTYKWKKKTKTKKKQKQKKKNKKK